MEESQNRKTGRINWIFVIFAAILFGVLTIESYLGAWSYDDGFRNRRVTIDYHLFLIMRFPTHTLLLDFINPDSAFIAILFFAGLLVNVIFYSFLSERIFYFLTKKKWGK
jgi:hypothetical protein